jgi:hypothetical protein
MLLLGEPVEQGEEEPVERVARGGQEEPVERAEFGERKFVH